MFLFSKPGTAIASFRNGKYADDHAAIYIGQDNTGIQVWDQWSGQSWHKRTLRKNYSGNKPRSNKADCFNVILS